MGRGHNRDNSSNLGGAYVFVDTASGRLIDAANLVLDAGVVPAGNYRATTNTFNANGSPTFTGETLVSILGAFGGTDVSGAWTLTISDNAFLDAGSLASWSISVGAVPEPSTFALLSVMAAGALGVRAWRKRKAA